MPKTRDAEGLSPLATRLLALIGKQSVNAWSKGHGLEQTTINRIVTGRMDPSFSVIQQIANKLGMQPWQLVGTAAGPDDVNELAQGLARLPDAARRRLVAKWLSEIDFAIEVRTGALDEAPEAQPEPTPQRVRGT